MGACAATLKIVLSLGGCKQFLAASAIQLGAGKTADVADNLLRLYFWRYRHTAVAQLNSLVRFV
jgi:hypothetical protein